FIFLRLFDNVSKIIDLYVSPNREYIEIVRSDKKRERVKAKDEKIGDSLAVLRYLLELLWFRVEEKDDKVVPYLLGSIVDNVNDPSLALPTKSLFAHSSKLFPSLKILFKYLGNTVFCYECSCCNAYDEIAKDLMNDVSSLYQKAFKVYTKSKNLESVKDLFKEFYKPKEIKVMPKISEEKIETKIAEEEPKPPAQLSAQQVFSSQVEVPRKMKRVEKPKPPEEEPTIDEMKKVIESHDFDPSKSYPLWWAHQKYLKMLEIVESEEEKNEIIKLLYEAVKEYITIEDYHRELSKFAKETKPEAPTIVPTLPPASKYQILLPNFNYKSEEANGGEMKRKKNGRRKLQA
ncbi:MAG: hypothetical protein QMD14_05420, partial [Candidatus Aenigmarchaeota archaeon]|nr:hypothetical protein [Candidatus Aenigmarchaeota archaeon]